MKFFLSKKDHAFNVVGFEKWIAAGTDKFHSVFRAVNNAGVLDSNGIIIPLFNGWRGFCELGLSPRGKNDSQQRDKHELRGRSEWPTYNGKNLTQ